MSLASISVVSSLALLCTWPVPGALPQVGGVSIPSVGDYNVLVVVLDDLGTDKFGFYTPTATANTPRINALRNNGILFTNAYVQPVCSPTRGELQCGRYGFRTGLTTFIVSAATSYELPSSEIFVPELLKGVIGPGGPTYGCGAFGKWHMSYFTGGLPQCHATTNGYDLFQGFTGNNDDGLLNPFRPEHENWDRYSSTPTSCPSTPTPVNAANPQPGGLIWDASVTRQDAVKFINSQISTTGHFFAYVAFHPPHANLEVPPHALISSATLNDPMMIDPATNLPYVEGRMFDFPDPQANIVHQAMIEATDAEVGNLLDGISPQDVLTKKTMVIVIDDNGTVGTVIQLPPPAPSHGKRTVYQLGTRVPLIVSGPLVPGPIPTGGYTCAKLVAGVDVWRTVGNIAGLTDAAIDTYMSSQFPPPHRVDSVSFLGLIEDPVNALGNRSYAFCENTDTNGAPPVHPSQWNRAINDGHYKYIVNQTNIDWNHVPPISRGSFEFYDLVADPVEATNLYSTINQGSGSPLDLKLTELKNALNAVMTP